jgi:hypothetical protein
MQLFWKVLLNCIKKYHPTKYTTKATYKKTANLSKKKACNQVSGLVSNVVPTNVPYKFPNGFSLGSHYVPNVFPNMLSIASHFYPICFGKCCPPFTSIDRPKERNSIDFKLKPFPLESLLSFISFWVMGQLTCKCNSSLQHSTHQFQDFIFAKLKK